MQHLRLAAGTITAISLRHAGVVFLGAKPVVRKHQQPTDAVMLSKLII
jgi:hypothetical protein